MELPTTFNELMKLARDVGRSSEGGIDLGLVFFYLVVIGLFSLLIKSVASGYAHFSGAQGHGGWSRRRNYNNNVPQEKMDTAMEKVFHTSGGNRDLEI